VSMTLPQILVDLMKLLFDLAVPAAICRWCWPGLRCVGKAA
jgi:hypothetical protein